MIVVTGIGVSTAIGCTAHLFMNALLEGKSAFSYLQRAGRQIEDSRFIGAEIKGDIGVDQPGNKLTRYASLSAQVGISTLQEAWNDAQLNDVDPFRIGLVIGGSNFQQRAHQLFREQYAEKIAYLNPSYSMTYLDYDLAAILTAQFGINGFAYTAGGTFASGQLAVIHAAKAVQNGEVDVCIALGALMDLSFWELQAYAGIGAMGSLRFADNPDLACRPFDADSDGFIYGEGCGVLIIESEASAERRKVRRYGQLAGWATKIDGNRGLNPSLQGECDVIRQSLFHADLKPGEINYINPHGSGSPLGDLTEANAIVECGLSHAWINSTKSIIGHTMTAAGIIELIALLLQMRVGVLHPCRNLNNPIFPELNWVSGTAMSEQIYNAINISIGQGGINTAVCIRSVQV
ncbi:polyketide beta-ketoacyl:ACP synthase [Chitinophaga sp. Mgbs1]|uniref:Polyketide beta-ketoacyl:ACP synthase n=1 Tax=Chitinophaga solisilvae TaxID=1233460 RepID=A0A3S1CZQ8_9BACT|nr:polyketide beta-ketoacyl:ACP synthase [Chitinophaga solisilvae]